MSQSHAPLGDPNHAIDLALFGALGDLAMRKLFPALYQLDRAGLLHDGTRILALAREAGHRTKMASSRHPTSKNQRSRLGTRGLQTCRSRSRIAQVGKRTMLKPDGSDTLKPEPSLLRGESCIDFGSSSPS